MPFHFVTVEGKSSRYGSIYEASDRDQLEESVKRQCGDERYCASRPLDTSYDALLHHAVHAKDEEAILKITKGVLNALITNLRKDGSDFADAVAMALPPYDEVSCYMPEYPSLKIRQDRTRCFRDEAVLSVKPSTLYRHCVNALEEGAASRIQSMQGYPYYFVSAQRDEGTIVDLIVRARGPGDVQSALKEKKIPLRQLVLQRLAPSVQEICVTADEMDEEQGNRDFFNCDRDPVSVMQFTRASFERWITGIHKEGQRIFSLHRDAYPADAPEDLSADPDTRADESDAWEKVSEYMDGDKPVRLTAAEIKEMTLDLLSHGCADHD